MFRTFSTGLIAQDPLFLAVCPLAVSSLVSKFQPFFEMWAGQVPGPKQVLSLTEVQLSDTELSHPRGNLTVPTSTALGSFAVSLAGKLTDS